MTTVDYLKELSPSQADLSERIFNLVIGLVIKKAYFGFDEKIRKDMDAVFASGSDKEKESFIENNIPDFNKLFEGEVKKIEGEIKAEIEKQI